MVQHLSEMRQRKGQKWAGPSVHAPFRRRKQTKSPVLSPVLQPIVWCTVQCGSGVPCTVHMWYVSFNLDKIMRLYGVNSESHLGQKLSCKFSLSFVLQYTCMWLCMRSVIVFITFPCRCVVLRMVFVQVHLLELDRCELLNQWSDTTNSLVCNTVTFLTHQGSMVGW